MYYKDFALQLNNSTSRLEMANFLGVEVGMEAEVIFGRKPESILNSIVFIIFKNVTVLLNLQLEFFFRVNI